MSDYRRIASFKNTAELRQYLADRRIALELDDRIESGPDSPLAQPATVAGRTLGNRWTIHPMEGWDAAPDGRATDAVRRRWNHFGLSGAKLIWGGEAMAVVPEARANPNQLIINPSTADSLTRLCQGMRDEHQRHFGNTDDLLVGFQLTHSGRFCRPRGGFEPVIAFRHPVLDRKFGVDSDDRIITDDQVKRLIDHYIAAAKIARQAGADFVDVKHCHGYLLHEFLAAHTRPGPFGGSFENRTRLLRDIASGIRAETPDLLIGVRLSAFDFIPYRPDPDKSQPGKPGPGIPETFDGESYDYGFGVDRSDPTRYDLAETRQFLQLLRDLDIRLVNLTAGSPYYNPHIQRPALFPPSDGYQPPEDPLAGVARQIDVVAQLKAEFDDLFLVGTAYTYLQEYLPHVAQHVLRAGMVDSIGVGRMVLSYPRMPADVLEGQTLDRKHICRTFSDCTTGPRNGLPSGCYPLDDYYKQSDHADQLRAIKEKAKAE